MVSVREGGTCTWYGCHLNCFQLQCYLNSLDEEIMWVTCNMGFIHVIVGVYNKNYDIK